MKDWLATRPIGIRVRHNMSRGLGTVVAHIDNLHITVKRDDGVTYDTLLFNWHRVEEK